MTEPTSITSRASAQSLELPALLAVVAALASTDLGAAELLGLEPTASPEALERHRQRYREAERLLEARQLVGPFEEPIAQLLERLESDRPPFDGRALLQIASLLRATEKARAQTRQADPPTPELAALTEELEDAEELRRRIEKTLDRRGRVRDDASPRLVRLRGSIRTVRDQLYRELRTVVDSEREHLSEDTIPLRGGRLVLMLNSGARGRVPGLVHGKSGTGKSFYFEPLGVVEQNNTLQEAVEEEEAERARILAELITDARRMLPALEAHARVLAELDRLQASIRFARTAGADLAGVAPAGTLRLVEARHPLLDPQLAQLRERALGESGHLGEVETLDLALEDDRILVVTGPNAGGKTVSLKTLGLLAAAHQCGLPIPAAAGTRLPLFDRIVAAVGDEQDLLTDRSTFSGRLLRLDEAWRQAREGSLILLDELGSGTDPEEGAALSVALLEGLLERRCLGLITTHLTPLAAAALELEGAACAAMEFDPETGAPTYRLVPGPPGGSEALALARRLGLPDEWLDRAEAKLGTDQRNLRRLLEEVETLRADLTRQREALESETRDVAKLRRRLAEREEELVDEKRKVGKRLRADLERFRQETRQELNSEVERLRSEIEAGRRKGLAATAEKRLFAEAPSAPEVPDTEPDAPITEGAPVRHKSLGWEGVLEKLQGNKAEVRVRGKKVRCSASELAGLAKPSPPAPKKPSRIGRSAESDLDERPITAEINLIGQRVEPALEALDGYLDHAVLSSRRDLRVIHGFGTGRLRSAVRKHLRRHPAVAEFRPGAANEGGDGATVVVLKGA